MNHIKLFLTIFLLLNLFACGPVVTFNTPQPDNTENVSNFPKRLQGQYISLDDSSLLSIDKTSVRRIYDFQYRLHPNELDSHYILSGDTLVFMDTHQKVGITHKGDSIVVPIHYIDTLFLINDEHILRKWKNYYFLNTRYDVNSWSVKKVDIRKNRLTISTISSKEEIETLKTLTEGQQDTIPPYTFSPTKKQFKEFVKKEGFGSKEVFVKYKQ